MFPVALYRALYNSSRKIGKDIWVFMLPTKKSNPTIFRRLVIFNSLKYHSSDERRILVFLRKPYLLRPLGVMWTYFCRTRYFFFKSNCTRLMIDASFQIPQYLMIPTHRNNFCQCCGFLGRPEFTHRSLGSKVHTTAGGIVATRSQAVTARQADDETAWGNFHWRLRRVYENLSSDYKDVD